LDRTCQKLDRRLSHFLRAWSIPYCSLPEVRDTRGQDLYLADGWHLTPAGHDYVANRLVDTVNMWVNGKKRFYEKTTAYAFVFFELGGSAQSFRWAA
jgi:hypothetical protein